MVLLAAESENWSKLWEPAAQHAPVLAAAGLVAGFIVLVAGGKLVRGGLILAGLAAGAGLGFLLAPTVFTQPAMWGVSTAAIGAALGGIGGAALASVLFRTAATAASAATLAALGVLIASLAFAYSKHDTILPPTAAGPAAQVWANAAAASLVRAEPVDPLAPPTLGSQVAAGCKAFAAATGELVQNLWNAATPDGRLYIAGGATLGVLVGLVMGVLSPARAMATTTALAGAGVCVGCLAVLAPHLGVETTGADRMGLCAFGALASLGVFVQWSSLRKPRRSGTSPATVPA